MSRSRKSRAPPVQSAHCAGTRRRAGPSRGAGFSREFNRDVRATKCFHVFSLPVPWRRRMILSEPMCRPVKESTHSRGVGHGCGGSAPRDRPSNVRLRPERWKAAYPGCVTSTSRPGLWLPDWGCWKAAYPGGVTLTSRPGLGLPGEWRPAASAIRGQIGGGGRQLIQAA